MRASDRIPAVDGVRLKPTTKVGLYRAANNMPGGWLMWMLEQYGINHVVMSAQDFQGDLNAKYDVILLPSGTTKARMVSGLDPKRNDPAEWAWAFGVGEVGWTQLRPSWRTAARCWPSARRSRPPATCSTCRSRARCRRRRPGSDRAPTARPRPRARMVTAVLRDAFSSPARLMQTLRDRVADPESLFYCPGSLLNNEFDTSHPVAWGMPAPWPVFFDDDQAYRLRPGFGVEAEVVSRYPREKVLASGWLLGEEYLKDQANILSFRIGKG